MTSDRIVNGCDRIVELEDGEVARLVKAELSSSYGNGSPKEWQVLILIGPPETVDEIATAMERTLRNAP